MNELRNCRDADVFLTAQIIPCQHSRFVFDVDRFFCIDLWPIIVICQDSASIWIIPGDDCSSVDDRGAWINRMMVSKCDSTLRELPKSRRVFLGNKVGTHAVPYNDDHVSILCGSCAGGNWS